MAKREAEKTTNVQARLTHDEVEDLDKVAADQPVPVTRAQLIAHILRKYLIDRRTSAEKAKRGK